MGSGLASLPSGRTVSAASLIALLFASVTLSGCWQGKEESKQGGQGASSAKLAQEQICVTSEVRVESGCEPGQRVVFMPGSWGNEQLPVMFAAMNCDLRYAVAMTNGGVTCVFMKARQPNKPDPAASAPASAQQKGQ
jgi:hypothetical protein